MSKLSDQINAELKTAMLQKDATRTSALRMLKSAVMNLDIAKPGVVISDQDVLDLVRKQIKQRQESIEMYKKGSRLDLAKKEESEIAVLQKFLPQEMSASDLEALIKKALSENSMSS